MRVKSTSFLMFLGFSVLTTFAATALATTKTATVASINTNDGGSGLTTVTFNGSGWTPVCSGSAFTFVLHSPSTDLGKAELSLLTAALLSGKSVFFIGTGSCTGLSPAPVAYEQLSYVSLQQ